MTHPACRESQCGISAETLFIRSDSRRWNRPFVIILLVQNGQRLDQKGNDYDKNKITHHIFFISQLSTPTGLLCKIVITTITVICAPAVWLGSVSSLQYWYVHFMYISCTACMNVAQSCRTLRLTEIKLPDTEMVQILPNSLHVDAVKLWMSPSAMSVLVAAVLNSLFTRRREDLCLPSFSVIFSSLFKLENRTFLSVPSAAEGRTASSVALYGCFDKIWH